MNLSIPLFILVVIVVSLVIYWSFWKYMLKIFFNDERLMEQNTDSIDDSSAQVSNGSGIDSQFNKDNDRRIVVKDLIFRLANELGIKGNLRFGFTDVYDEYYNEKDLYILKFELWKGTSPFSARSAEFQVIFQGAESITISVNTRQTGLFGCKIEDLEELTLKLRPTIQKWGGFNPAKVVNNIQ